MYANKIIFISALDWGLGHATRCIPVIETLKKNNQIIIGVTPVTKNIFDEEFPDLKKINLPSYGIRYSKILPLWFKMMLDASRIKKIIKQENKLLKNIIKEHQIDVVISDSRFGLYSERIHSVFITHQLFLKTPFANHFLQNINKKFILKFNEVLIPDFEDENISLSGELSHGIHYHNKVRYIGPLSRLKSADVKVKKYRYLFLISGPEPQQSIFTDILLKKTETGPHIKVALVIPETDKSVNEQIDLFVSPDKERLSTIFAESETIICRSGYSTLMDLYTLEKKEIILVPTPGQTEQEYLAEYWNKKFGAIVISQKELISLQL